MGVVVTRLSILLFGFFFIFFLVSNGKADSIDCITTYDPVSGEARLPCVDTGEDRLYEVEMRQVSPDVFNITKITEAELTQRELIIETFNEDKLVKGAISELHQQSLRNSHTKVITLDLQKQDQQHSDFLVIMFFETESKPDTSISEEEASVIGRVQLFGGVPDQVDLISLTPVNPGQADENDDAITEIKFGRYAGFCIGYCTQEITITPTSLNYQNIPRGDETLELVNVNQRYTQQDWSKLTELLNYSAFLELPKTIGCPDCGDQGGYYIQITQNGSTRRLDIDADILITDTAIDPFYKKLREILTQQINNRSNS